MSVVDGHGGGTRLWLDVRADFTLGPGHFVVISQDFKEETRSTVLLYIYSHLRFVVANFTSKHKRLS